MPATEAPPPRASWAYVAEPGERDSRVDFLRGVAMVSVVIVHVEFFSLFNFVAWERVGGVSSAEFFVVLSGFVLGEVSRRRVAREGLGGACWKLWERAAQLYGVLLGVALLGALVASMPYWDSSALTTFVDRGSGTVYPLYPGTGASLQQWVGRWLLLRMGPYQVQILGLYAALFLVAPAALYLLSAGRTRWLLVLSWVGYCSRWVVPSKPTGALFEHAFPLLTWQLLFCHGLAAGYHRQKLLALYARYRTPVLGAAVLLGAAFFFFAQNNPNPLVPEYARLSLIPRGSFYRLYWQFFSKSELGLLRILNVAVLLVLGGELLTRAWGPLRAALGGFFIPLGQASLYVFALHVPVVFIVSNLIPFGYAASGGALLLNTLGHLGCLAVLWLLVRYRFLYRWIPH
ncbi:OpgC domain-containing protein [Hyalangium gracile]|uniref:OpgC domain-containing protein n=1 Tax=Hyalangium gracile TaxID=394092 RepID=UPI001CCA16EF|nr:OpgC domain-containing protein [Hyalangium gracile]